MLIIFLHFLKVIHNFLTKTIKNNKFKVPTKPNEISMPKNILIFNGGGLAPALNPTLYGAIKEAKEQGFNILGGMYGWACLLDKGKIIDLNKINIEPIKNIGGTFLRSSRTNPFKIQGGLDKLESKIKEHKIDCIAAIGGDDTLGAAKKLFGEKNIPIVAIPKTIDNDLSETYFTPGFPTAAYYLYNYVSEIKKDAAYALSRIYVIESLGMNAGWLTASSIYGQADIIIPPEKEVSLDKVLNLLNQKYKQNKNFAVIVVAQEAKFDKQINGIAQNQKDDLFNVKRQHFICLALKDRIEKELSIETKPLYPGNYLESGNPIEIDKKYAIALGKKAINLIKEGQFGKMVALKKPDWQKNELEINSVKLSKVVGKKNYKKLPDEYFDYENFRPSSKFLEYTEPMLGKLKEEEDDYIKLIKSIN